MNTTAEKLSATVKANVQALQSLATEAQADAKKLAELNLATSQSVLAESLQHAQAMMGVKDIQTLTALQTGIAKSMTEKFTAYAQNFMEIAASASAEFTMTAQDNMAQVQKSFTELVKTATSNAPAGTEPAMAFFNNAMSASQNAFTVFQNTAQKAAESAQANFTAATAQAVDAVIKAKKSA